MFLLGSLFLLICSYAIVTLPMAVGMKGEDIDAGYFKIKDVGRFAFLFGNSKWYPIKERGISIPCFIMQIIAYIDLIIMWLGYLVCTIVFEINEPLLFGGIGCAISFLCDVLIIGSSKIIIQCLGKE